jgi:3-oxoacyl-[acyl-carrier protein] reductase
MTYSIDLSGKTALITGGTRGIGAAIADVLAAANADIIITGTQEQTVNSKMEELDSKGKGLVQGWAADFTDKTSLEKICDRIKSLAGIHILVNNAGANHIVPIDGVKSFDLDKILSLNLHAPTLLSAASASVMKKQNWGRIINIASIWSVITKPGRAMYTASKFGIVGLTKATAADLGGYNVLVNALSPGFTRTDLTNSTVPVDEQERIAQQIPMRRFAEPEEMAKVVLFLCSDLNTYITGQNIVVDGGFVIV